MFNNNLTGKSKNTSLGFNLAQSSEIPPFYVDYRETKSPYESQNNNLNNKNTSSNNYHSNDLQSEPSFKPGKNNATNEKHNIKPKKPAIIKASLTLILCIIGSIIFTNYANIKTFDAVFEENFNDFLLPIVFNDPEPFDNIEELNLNKILSASIWYTVLFQENQHYTNYDSLGRVIIPSEDIAKSASILFGSEYSMPIENPSSKSFFELDSTGKNYLIKPISNTESYIPTVISKKNHHNEMILHVGYSKPEDPFWTNSDKESTPKFEKTMDYILKKDNITGKMYIKSVQNPTDN